MNDKCIENECIIGFIGINCYFSYLETKFSIFLRSNLK